MIRATLLCLLLSTACACSAPHEPQSSAGTATSAEVPVPKANPVTTAAAPERPTGSATSDALTALRSLKRLDTASPDVQRLLKTQFDGSCAPDERMAFDAVCQAYGANDSGDPSPWPEVLVGLRDGRIASVVAIARDPSLDGWRCEAVTVPEHTQACYPPTTPEPDRVRWTQQWSAFFSAAD